MFDRSPRRTVSNFGRRVGGGSINLAVICLTEMKPPRSLKITDTETVTGRPCVPDDLAVCHCVCIRRKGDVVFTSDPDDPYRIRVGGRDCFVGIEYGLLGMRVGGKRSILVAPNLTYHERKTFREISEGTMLIDELRLVDLPEKWDAEMESRRANHVAK